MLQLFGHRCPFIVCELNNNLQTCLLAFVSENSFAFACDN